MAAIAIILKVYFELLKKRKASWLETGCHGRHLENLYWTFQPKSQLTWNWSGNQVSDKGPTWHLCYLFEKMWIGIDNTHEMRLDTGKKLAECKPKLHHP